MKILDKIPIVFSTDDNYVLPLCVAIESVIKFKRKNPEKMSAILFLPSFKFDKIKNINDGKPAKR